MELSHVAIFVAMTTVAYVSAGNAPPIAKSPAGIFHGKRTTTTVGGEARTVFQFLGIPYAEAPEGLLRFKKPVTKEPMTDKFYATEYGPICPQLLYGPDSPALELIGEDCLRLNIFIPGDVVSINSANYQPKAVMIWIHDGSFFSGASNFYDASLLSAANGVVIVTINYRLSVFGFLSTGDENIPGNMGLWDQHEAIKWVHRNIRSFGGDPSRVTLFGSSAGGASVFYQATFPGNAGLFHRIIAQSGSSATQFAFSAFDDEWVQFNTFFASTIGCSTTNNSALVECLREIPFTNIMQALTARDGNIHVRAPFTPMVDGSFIKIDPKLLMSGQVTAGPEIDMLKSVDVLTGVNDEDGVIGASVFVFGLLAGDPTLITGIPTGLITGLIVPTFVDELFSNGECPSNLPALGATLWYAYKNFEQDNPVSNRDRLFDLITDSVFTMPAIRSASLHSKVATDRKTYFYQLAYRPSYELLPWVTSARHLNDIALVFGFQTPIGVPSGAQPTTTEIMTSKNVMEAWANFAKNGDPSSASYTWLEFDRTDQNYTKIPGPAFTQQQRPLSTQLQYFWDVVVTAFGLLNC